MLQKTSFAKPNLIDEAREVVENRGRTTKNIYFGIIITVDRVFVLLDIAVQLGKSRFDYFDKKHEIVRCPNDAIGFQKDER